MPRTAYVVIISPAQSAEDFLSYIALQTNTQSFLYTYIDVLTNPKQTLMNAST